jgi:hypothetical protein
MNSYARLHLTAFLLLSFVAFTEVPAVGADVGHPADSQKVQYTQANSAEFIAGLTKLSKSLGCVFLLRPSTFKLIRVSNMSSGPGIGKFPDYMSPDVATFLNMYDCSATRFGDVYVIQPRFSDDDEVPLVSVEECEQRLVQMETLTAVPNADLEWTKAEIAHKSIADCSNTLAQFDIMELSSMKESSGHTLVCLTFPKTGPGINKLIPLPDVDTEATSMAAGQSSKQEILHPAEDRPDDNASIDAEGPINTAVAAVPLVDKQRKVTADINDKVLCIAGGPVYASQLASGLGWLFALQVRYDDGVFHLEVPDMKGSSFASIPDYLNAVIPEPYLCYLHMGDADRRHDYLIPASAIKKAPIGNEEQAYLGEYVFPKGYRGMPPGDRARGIMEARTLTQRSEQLRAASERKIAAYWAESGMSGEFAYKFVSQLPADIQSAIVDYVMADVFKDISSLYGMPNSLLHFDNESLNELRYLKR